jgi:hypothetical protein
MASEPKKPIEQVLEALAKARRAEFGDDPKMPNPMRARLQEEIARAGAAEDEKDEPRASWVTMFWPRVTVAAALAMLIVLVPAIWWNQSHPIAKSGDLALRDGAAGAAHELNPAVPAEDTLAKAPPVSATEPTVNLADNWQIKIEPVRTGVLGFSHQQFPVAQQSSSGSLATTQQFSQQTEVQSFRNNAQVNRAANVLNTFQVQQEGNEIRVLDADGSTYTGKIQQSAKSGEVDSRITARRVFAKQTRNYAAKATGKSESTAPQSCFRATGYNVSLKKTLVFEGNYAEPHAQQPATKTSNDREPAEQSRERARIIGTVRVNGEPPVEVDAIADTPEPAKASSFP